MICANCLHMHSHQTSHSCILQLLYVFWCEWIDQCPRQCSVCVSKCEEILLVLHGLLLSLKGPSRPLQRKNSLLFVPARWPVQLSLERSLFNLEEMGPQLDWKWSGINFSTQPAAQRCSVVLDSLSFWTVNIVGRIKPSRCISSYCGFELAWCLTKTSHYTPQTSPYLINIKVYHE